jgi:polyisoprenoid-binding protein YceI
VGRATRPLAGGSGEALSVTVTVHGVEHTVQAPVQVETRGASVAATGHIALKQTDFGMTPLSVLGGAIQVKDEVNVRFVIRAAGLE